MYKCISNYLILTTLFILSCKPNVQSISDKKFCKLYFDRTLKYNYSTFDFDEEMNRRRTRRVDSITNGIIYETILSQPDCFPARSIWFNQNGEKVISYTEEFIKEEQMHKPVSTELNGLVIYHFREDSLGNLVKDNVTKPIKNFNSSIMLEINNDSITIDEDFILFLSELKFAVKDFDPLIFHDGVLLQKRDLVMYDETKMRKHYKYVIKEYTPGKHEIKGVINVIQKEGESLRIPVDFKYFVKNDIH